MKVFVPPHVRLSNTGKRIMVDGYWRKATAREIERSNSRKGVKTPTPVNEPMQSPPESENLGRFIPNSHRNGDKFTDVGWDSYRKESDRTYRKVSDHLATTSEQHFSPARGWYTPERTKQWSAVLKDILTEAEENKVPKERKAVVVGGLPGAGKSSSLRDNAITEQKYIHLDSDKIKELMIKHDLAPQVEGLAPLESVGLIHRESTDIMDLVFSHLTNKGYNIVLDGTLSDGAERFVRQQMADLRDTGYSVKGLFIHVTPETSRRRAESRYRQGMEEYLFKGRGYGGRSIPSNVFEWKPPGRRNKDVFERLKEQFDDWLEYNNDKDGRAPQETGRSSEIVEFSWREVW